MKLIKQFEGHLKHEYAILEDYVAELKKSNKDNAIKLEREDDSNMFKRLYVCFYVIKKGFKVDCKPLISLNGWFLKGSIKSQILSAVERDANNQMFPLAWDV